jgi:hypothetical protein
MSIKHFKKMIDNNRCELKIASMFLSKAILNFTYDEEMLNKIYLIMEQKLKKENSFSDEEEE